MSSTAITYFKDVNLIPLRWPQNGHARFDSDTFARDVDELLVGFIIK